MVLDKQKIGNDKNDDDEVSDNISCWMPSTAASSSSRSRDVLSYKRTDTKIIWYDYTILLATLFFTGSQHRKGMADNHCWF